MKLGIDNFEQFKIFFDVIYDITDLIELQLYQSHMFCSILDKSHSRFMTVEYKAEFFSLYEVDEVESVTVFAEDLHKIIKSVNNVDNVLLETNDNYMICKVESRNGNSRVFEFVLPAEYIESPQPPSLTLPVALKLSLSDLKQGIKDLKIVGSDIVKFVVSENQLNILAGTEITTNYSYNCAVDVSVDWNMSSMFSLGYIEQLLKFEKINKTVELKLGNDYPLVYSFEDDIMGVKVSGLIAPRLEIED